MFRAFRYREGRYRELPDVIPPIPAILSALPEEDGFRVEFYNTSGVKIGVLGSDIQQNPVLRIEFTAEEFGPGEFRMELSAAPGFSIGYLTQVRVYPFFSLKPWFTGFIKNIPQNRKPGEPLIYEGYGYYAQLARVLVNGTFTAPDAALLWMQIINNYLVGNTGIGFSWLWIGNTGWNTLTEINWDYVEAGTAGEDLAKLSGNFVFGVNELAKGFFKQVFTTAKNHWWEGIHFTACDIVLNTDNLVNRVYVKGGETDAQGSNILTTRENGDSITAYGLHEKVIDLPSAMEVADAETFGDYQLALYKDPRYTGTVSGLNLKLLAGLRPVVVNGKARVTLYDGTEYQIQVRRVKYTISSEGILADVELGELEAPIEGPFLEIARKIAAETRINDRRAVEAATP